MSRPEAPPDSGEQWEGAPDSSDSSREASLDEAGGGCVCSVSSGQMAGTYWPQKGKGSGKEEPANRASSVPGCCATTARGLPGRTHRPAVLGSPLQLREPGAHSRQLCETR